MAERAARGSRVSGRFLRFERAARRRSLHPLLADAASTTDADLDAPLFEGRRPRLTAAWLIGVSRRTSYRTRLGELLPADETVYAEPGS
ncbi:DUF6000 family protein [Streptomyces sp. MNU76]|uniref:DUF6000 family protein n=1 Tax=Streptomyces sp. MNU76 TaxID=2560026 RepID=UPI001E427EE5|nr:DUF6000 family protein [Streptomyces sp. MNU76]MCC9707036.1 DUF6000 family protein [Streptomyces sp. MNU76]